MTQAVHGGQVVSRIARILRELSGAPGGMRTSDLALAAGLTRPTTYRLLRSLAAEGYVDVDASTSRWLLGPELFVMGSIAASRYDITTIATSFVQRLAAVTGESAFFSVRRGDETVCLLREEGSFPVRSFVLYEGVRFPLGVASAGLAILSFMPDNDVDAYLQRANLEAWGESHSTLLVRERIHRTRDRGFAVNPGLIVEGSWGMGAAVFDAGGGPAYALSITGIESRFSEARRSTLGRILMEEAHAMSRRIAGAR